MFTASPETPKAPQAAERRKWVRYPCHRRGQGGHLVAYLSGSLMAENIRDLSAGGLSLALDHRVEPGPLTIELYHLGTHFRRTVPAGVVSVAEIADSFLVGVAFSRPLSVAELQSLL